MRNSCHGLIYLIMIKVLKIIGEPHAVGKTKTGRPGIPFCQFSPVATLYGVITQYPNQKIDIDTIHRSSDFTSFTCPRLCLSLFSSMQFHPTCRFVYSPSQSSYITTGDFFEKILNLFTLLVFLTVLFKQCSLGSLTSYPSASLQLKQVHIHVFYILSFIISLHLGNKFLV